MKIKNSKFCLENYLNRECLKKCTKIPRFNEKNDKFQQEGYKITTRKG